MLSSTTFGRKLNYVSNSLNYKLKNKMLKHKKIKMIFGVQKTLSFLGNKNIFCTLENEIFCAPKTSEFFRAPKNRGFLLK